jgi:trans-2,3-dihydro-3-hydroxyanthranilate isomerase
LHGGDAQTLEMHAGIIPVRADGDEWTLQANAPRTRPVAASPVELAAMLGLDAADIGRDAMWVDTGSEQLVIPLASAGAVQRSLPKADLLAQHGSVVLPGGASRAMAYVWAEAAPDAVLARFFFPKHGAVVEDPGTGSACANLGGWLVATGAPLPQRRTITQGDAVGRRCSLRLVVDTDGQIFVGGRVIELGRGTIDL